VDRLRVQLFSEPHQLVLGLAAADDQSRSACAQLSVQIGEALEQELGARAGRVAAMQKPVVEAEDRDDLLVTVKGGAQPRVVADAQVAPKPDDPGGFWTAIAGAGGRSGSPPPLRRLIQTSLATSTTSFAGASMTSSRRKSSATPL
jgi:hypothetical protein